MALVEPAPLRLPRLRNLGEQPQGALERGLSVSAGRHWRHQNLGRSQGEQPCQGVCYPRFVAPQGASVDHRIAPGPLCDLFEACSAKHILAKGGTREEAELLADRRPYLLGVVMDAYRCMRNQGRHHVCSMPARPLVPNPRRKRPGASCASTCTCCTTAMGWRGKVCVMAVPSSMCCVRRAAAARAPRGSAPPAPALVSHAAGIPCCSRWVMLVRTAELSGADTTIPSLFCPILLPPILT